MMNVCGIEVFLVYITVVPEVAILYNTTNASEFSNFRINHDHVTKGISVNPRITREIHLRRSSAVVGWITLISLLHFLFSNSFVYRFSVIGRAGGHSCTVMPTQAIRDAKTPVGFMTDLQWRHLTAKGARPNSLQEEWDLSSMSCVR